MIATWVFGVLWLLTPGMVDWSSDGWIYVKLAAVLVLTWFHHWLARRRRTSPPTATPCRARHYRLMNEVPTRGAGRDRRSW